MREQMLDACRLYYNTAAAAVTNASSTDWSLPRSSETRSSELENFKQTSLGEEVKAVYICSESLVLDGHKARGVCDEEVKCDEAYLKDNVGDNANASERTCSACNIQYSLENYPDNVPVFVPRCLHIICSTCCKDKASANRKCPVDGCGMDCAGEASAFPMHVVILQQLRTLYTKRKSPSMPCTADCDTNQQHQQGAASGEASGPIKHDAKWFCSICDENFCDEYYQNVHQRFKVTKVHPVVSLEDIDPVDRHEVSITKCSDPRHLGTNVSMYDASTRTFHCGLCTLSPHAESAANIMQKDYAAIADMLQSSEGFYARCTELHRSIGARIVYESSMLKSECDRVNAWYSASIDRLSQVRDSSLAELRNVSKQTQTKLKAEFAKLTPLVQSVEAAAVDIGVRPYRHTGESLHRRTHHSDAPVVRKAKELLDSLNDLLTQLRSPAQDCYTRASGKGPVTRNTIGSTVAADILVPVSQESPHFITSMNTAVDVALNIVQSSSLSAPSSASSTSQTSMLSPVAAFHLLHRTATAKDATNKLSIPLVWFALGHCYHRGIGTSSSLQDAVNWYSKAAEAGMLWAMEMIAECHADDHWATSEKDKCKSVYADAIHRAVLYRSIAECKSCSEAPTAAALLVRTWALYPFTRDIGSLRADSPSMKEYKSTLPTLLRTHFLPRVMPVNNEVAHQKDPLALFTLLNADFRSVVPREEWYDILSQVGNTLSLAPAHHLIAKELVVGSRYYMQRDGDSDDAMSVSSSSATASGTAASSTATATSASSSSASSSSSIFSSVTTSSDVGGVPSTTRLTWSEKLWKSVEWIHDIAVNRGNNDTLADPLAALGLAELSCDYLEGCFSLTRLPSYSNAKKNKAFDWFQAFDAAESRLSQVRMLLSRWLHPVIMDGYESARVLSARLVLTREYLVAKSDKSGGVNSRDFARVVVESTCPQGSSSAFALCRRLLWNAITKHTYASNPSSLAECGVIPRQAIMNDISQSPATTPSLTSASTSTSTSTSTTSLASLVVDPRSTTATSSRGSLCCYVGLTASPQLTPPVMALSNHVAMLGTAADKGSVDARGVIADCHFLQLCIRKHRTPPQSTSAAASGDEQRGSLNKSLTIDEHGALLAWDLVAADLGDTSSALKAAARYMKGRKGRDDYVKAFALYEKAAHAGDVTAMHQLGLCYRDGTGVAKDDSKAFEWYRKAADGGDVLATFYLGYCYHYGTGIAKDPSKTIQCYTKAVDSGNVAAMNNLGVCYENGTGVAKDKSMAIEWYTKAADGGEVTAMRNLGVCYESGSGVLKDQSTAFAWYKKAADGGDVTAMRSLASCYKIGTGVAQDASKAFEWYTKAADGGDVQAMRSLASCYKIGTGVAKDASKAFEWYKKAADGGDVEAMGSLAFSYRYGSVVAKDELKAAEWDKKAANGGNVTTK